MFFTLGMFIFAVSIGSSAMGFCSRLVMFCRFIVRVFHGFLSCCPTNFRDHTPSCSPETDRVWSKLITFNFGHFECTTRHHQARAPLVGFPSFEVNNKASRGVIDGRGGCSMPRSLNHPAHPASTPLHDPPASPAMDPPNRPLHDPPGDPTYEPPQPVTEPTPNPTSDPPLQTPGDPRG